MTKSSIVSALLVFTFLLGSGATCAKSQDPNKTHFLFVHGTGHGAWCWYKVITILRTAGFEATALDMISAGRDKTRADDARSLPQYAKPLTDFLANVSGKLFPRLLGEQALSFNFANGPSAPATSISVNLTVIAGTLYNKSPPQDVMLGLSLLDDEPEAPLVEILSLTRARYGSVRRFFLHTDKDNVFTTSGLDYIIKQNPPEDVFFIKGSDHSAFFSKAAELSALLVQISTL